MDTNQEKLLEILKGKNIDELNKIELKDFIKNCDDDSYLKNTAKNIYKKLKAKINIEKQIKHHKKMLKSLELSESLLREDLYSKINKNNYVPNVEECYELNFLSKRIELVTASEYGEKENCKYFRTENEANDFLNFIEKIQVGVRFKIKNQGNWNDGVYNNDAKKFYSIEKREKVYNFDKDKIWTIVKVGYFENCLPMPLTESHCKDESGNDIIDWQMPRYMYNNIEFIKD